MAAPLLSAELRRKLDQLEIVTRRSFMGRMRGEQKSVRKGHSLEFADYRKYAAGDDIRYIDWKVYARLDKLFLKLFMEEEDLFVHLLVDVSLSMAMGDPEKLHYARQLSAALSYLSLAGTHRVGVFPFSEGLQQPLSYLRGKGQVQRVLKYLESLQPGQETHALDAVHRFREQTLGSGMIFVLSDLLDKDGFERALKRMVGGRFEIVVFHLLSPEEEELSGEGDWRMVDVEDGETVQVSITERFREEYAETVRKFRGEHKELCHRLGFHYVPLRTDQPVEQVLLHRLRRQGVLS